MESPKGIGCGAAWDTHGVSKSQRGTEEPKAVHGVDGACDRKTPLDCRARKSWEMWPPFASLSLLKHLFLYLRHRPLPDSRVPSVSLAPCSG